MPRELTACEIDSIMVGATFLGAGAVVHWIPAANC